MLRNNRYRVWLYEVHILFLPCKGPQNSLHFAITITRIFKINVHILDQVVYKIGIVDYSFLEVVFVFY